MTNPIYVQQAVSLTNRFEDTFSVPCVLAGLEIIRGHAWGWASLFEPWHWDIAASSVLIGEIGGVVMCANGDVLDWSRERLPPVIFARSQTYAAEIAAVLNQE